MGNGWLMKASMVLVVGMLVWEGHWIYKNGWKIQKEHTESPEGFIEGQFPVAAYTSGGYGSASEHNDEAAAEGGTILVSNGVLSDQDYLPTGVDAVEAEGAQETVPVGNSGDGSSDNGSRAGGTLSTSAWNRQQEQNQQTTRTTQMIQSTGNSKDADIDHAINEILSESRKELYEGYSIDESFLSWIAANYGFGTVEHVAQAVENGDMDSEIWYRETGCSIHALWVNYCRKLDYATYQFPDIRWKDSADDSKIVMDFIGDINFDEEWYTMTALTERGGNISDCISPDIQKELQSADITVLNNEFTYSTNGEALEGKAYTFRTDPENVELLNVFGADLVSLGNNHVCDYGDDALLDTFDTLEKADIPYIGAGRNLDEAQSIEYFVINGRKIAIVAATQIEKTYNYTKEATYDSPGVLKTLDPERFLMVIQEAKAHSDYVIVYVHWGSEGMLYTENDQKVLAQKFVKAGADVIIGNHSHRLQGVQYVDGVPVINSLGNFWFSNGSIYATIAQVTITKNGELGVSMIPCVQKNLTTSMLTEKKDIRLFYQYIADLSENVGIDENGRIYNLSGKTDEEIAKFPYISGQHYSEHSGAYDLEGRRINIVGNLVQSL